MTYALITLNSPISEYVGYRRDFADEPPTLAPEKNMQWVPVVEAPVTTFDPATQRLVRLSDLVEFDRVTIKRDVAQALTQEELDARAAESAAETEREQARQAYLALKNEDGSTPAGQRIRRLELIVARMIRDQYGPASS